MKKILALLVALMMALSCTLALAEESEIAFPGITIASELDVDTEAATQLLTAFGVAEDQLPVAQAVLALLDAVSEQLIVADGGVEYDLAFNGNSALTLGGALDESGITVVSSLFPSYVLTLSQETLSALLEQVFASASEELKGLEGIDFEGLTKAVSDYSEELINSLTAAVTTGEPVQENYEIDGHQFNVKVPMNVDMDAIAAALQKFVDQINSDEAVKAAMSSLEGMGIKAPAEDTSNLFGGEAQPAVAAELYMNIDDQGNDNGDTYVLVTVTPNGADTPATLVHVLVSNDIPEVTVEIPESNTVAKFTYAPTDDGIGCNLDVNANGMYIGVVANYSMTDVITLACDLYVMDDTKPLLSEITTLTFEGALGISLDADGRTVVAIEDLMGENASEAASGLLMDVLGGLGGLIGTITEAVPEAASLSDLAGALMGGMLGGE